MMRTLLRFGLPAALTLCMLASFNNTSAQQSRQTVALASSPWAPFTDVPDKPRFAIDLVDAALERAGYSATHASLETGTVIPALRVGKHDGGSALWKNRSREKFLRYSLPYLENRLILVARKGTDVDVGKFSELKGKRLALVKGWAYGDEVQARRGPELVMGASLQENLDRLLEGKVDYMLIDEIVALHLAAAYPEKAKKFLVFGKRTMVRRTLHLAVRRDMPNSEGIVLAFDKAIQSMMVDGSYNRILRLGWIRTDVDGDGVDEFVLAGDHAGTAPPEESSYAVFEGEQEQPTKKRKRRGFYIERRYYDTWDQVPDRYKIPPEQHHKKDNWGVVLFDW